MDLRFTPEEVAFRDEVRAFIRDNLPAEIRERMRLGYGPRKQDTVALAAHPEQARAGRRCPGRRSGAARAGPRSSG